MFRIKSIEIESKLVVSRSWGEEECERMGNNCLMSMRFPFSGDENVLELDGDGSCTIL